MFTIHFNILWTSAYSNLHVKKVDLINAECLSRKIFDRQLIGTRWITGQCRSYFKLYIISYKMPDMCM